MLTGKQKRQLETSIYMNKKDKIDNVLSQLIYKTKKNYPKVFALGQFLILRNCISYLFSFQVTPSFVSLTSKPAFARASRI